jgi:glycosyltransferase involved in cell wall biosynthesis
LSSSVTVLLPVHNAQERLARAVAEILDVLPELTPRFEVVIIDDGSLDETAEAAYALARCYPQVAVVRHPFRMGLSAAIESGLERSIGDVVFVADENHGVDPQDLRKLWQMHAVGAAGQSRESTLQARAAWAERWLNWQPAQRLGAPKLGAIRIFRRPRPDQATGPSGPSPGMRIDPSTERFHRPSHRGDRQSRRLPGW